MSRVRERLLMPALVLSTMTVGVVSSLGAPLVPQVAEETGVPISAAQWSLTATLLAAAIAVPVLGRLGSHRYRRPVILAALCLTLAGCLISILPFGLTAVIVGRVLQGIGMGVTPVTLALARNVLSPAKQVSGLALLSVINMVGAGIGYPISAFFGTVFGLDGAYWFGAAVLTVSLAAAVIAIPGATAERAEPRIDWLGVVLLSLGSGSLLLTITQGQEWGWLSPTLLVTVAVSAVALVLFCRRSLRIPNPLIDLRLTVRSGVIGPNATGFFMGLCVYMLFPIVTVLVHQPVEDGGFGLPIVAAGLLVLVFAASSFTISRINLIVTRRIPVDLLLPVGCALMATALLVISFARAELSVIALTMVLAGFGAGCVFAILPGLIFRHASPQESGSAMSVNQLLRNFGFATGSALAGALLGAFLIPATGATSPAGFTAVALTGAAMGAVATVLSLVLAIRAVRSDQA